MIDFNSRRLERTKTLGERLRKVREEAGLTLDDAEAGTQIRRKYLEAMEDGQYSLLPGPVYIENFLKKYATWLKVSEEFVLDVYRHQEQKILKKEYRPDWSQQRSKVPRSIITPRVIKIVLISLIILACLTYVGLEVAKIFSPPPLTITDPRENSTVHEQSIQIIGKTQPEVTVTINGQQVYADAKGNFTEMITLKEGLNTIVISASKERSKPTIVQRNVLFEKTSPTSNN
jgi:cytoskeletal protein RodZ